MTQASGRTVGNYIVGPMIGRGGMSQVFAGTHRFLGHAVAVKLLRAHLGDDETIAERFLQEARRTRSIEHLNVVRVLDFGRTDDDGALYLVMERLEGEDLSARLERGALAEAEMRRIGAAIADGMAAAHERGIVHRDLKPANVRLLPDGTPKILDFGISAAVEPERDSTRSPIGTPEYMAPEQLGGGVVGPFTDVWALGVVLYEAIAGALPFDGFANGAAPQLFHAPRPLRERVAVSLELEELIGRCLQRHPAERPSTMREIAARLRGDAPAVERTTQPASPPTVQSTMPSTVASAPRALAHGKKWRRGTLALATVVAAAVGVAAWHGTHRATATPSAAAMPPATALPATATPAATTAPAAAERPPLTVAPPPSPRPHHKRNVQPAKSDAHPRSRVYHEQLD